MKPEQQKQTPATFKTLGSVGRRGPISDAAAFPAKPGLDSLEAGKFCLRPSIEFVITILFLGDALVILGALCFGFHMGFHPGQILPANNVPAVVTASSAFWEYLDLLVVETILLLGTFAYMHLYSRHCFMNFSKTAKVILHGSIFWLLVYLAFTFVLGFDTSITRLLMVFSFVCVAGGMLLWRFAFYRLMCWETLAVNLRQRVLFVGWGKEAEQLEQKIRRDLNHPYDIIGYLPSPQCRLYDQPPARVPALGDYQNLPTLLKERRTDIVILADLNMNMGEIVELVNVCEMEFAQFKVIPSYFQILASGLQLETISGIPVLGVSELPLDHLPNRVLKRIVDIIGAIVGLIIAAPLIAIFGALVYRESPGPIFYPQERAGRGGRNFKMSKIRSMKMDAETESQAQWCKEDDPRRLKIGVFMRKYNIDEVPQFWNVLKGEMSLVGPRPERPELITNFELQVPHYHARHTCTPGMTGWAQVNGWRGDTSLEERIRHDIWYVENWSFGLDLRIMILTLGDCFLGTQRNAY